MQVIKRNEVVNDGWTRIEQDAVDEGLPDADLIVPLAYWQSHREELLQRGSKVAVCINGDDELAEIEADLGEFELIAVEFPLFKDGRAYSLARALRQRYGYEGDIRAVGDVLRDQLYFMQRCGISSFQLKEGKDAEDALKGLSDFSVKYQSAVDGAQPIYRQR